MTPRYRIQLTPVAERQLGRVRGPARVALRGAVLGLGTEPRPHGALKLRAPRALWRVRLRIDGVPWRIVYQLHDPERLVVVTKIARRDGGTYRKL